ncbi:FkbM family methyltransferase [Vreelandella rituensis]|uniref:FkbM family methyltransferase n=1 Tax=Vreelandella rituensis TaxID=2282306 RepID=A0A368U6Z7_9GAMM|nr:FkbM family methyltransferase [Halomonas rituensis]RCV92938.1 FkbM family methyltransferase [Halomonas rituensis]
MTERVEMSLTQRLKGAVGLGRSLFIYWRPGRQTSLQRLYRPFIVPGDIAFDVGAHLGDRSAAFRSLGAQVVALEPQPELARWLARLLGSRSITLLEMAAGAEAGHADIALSATHPTLATLASEWREQIGQRNPDFRQVRWEQRLRVPVTTLDALIGEHGQPAFIKIDVEGFEAEVLKGLSHAVPALSFEVVAGALSVGNACISRLEQLGDYRYNAVSGEQRRFLWPHWQPAHRMQQWLESGADALASGDIYACRSDHSLFN